MAKTSTGGLPDDLGKWLAVGTALVSLGVLPKTWQKGLGVAGALLYLYQRW